MPRNVVATGETVGSAAASAAACAHMVMGEMVTAQPVRPPDEETGAAAGAAAACSARLWAATTAAKAVRAPARVRERDMTVVSRGHTGMHTQGGTWGCAGGERRE